MGIVRCNNSSFSLSSARRLSTLSFPYYKIDILPHSKHHKRGYGSSLVQCIRLALSALSCSTSIRMHSKRVMILLPTLLRHFPTPGSLSPFFLSFLEFSGTRQVSRRRGLYYMTGRERRWGERRGGILEVLI